MTEGEDFYSTSVGNCVFNAVLSYTAIMLNIITIHVLRKTSSLPKPLKTLLLSLAVADLGVGLLVQPLNITHLVMNMKPSTNKNTYNAIYMAYLIPAYLFSFSSLFGVVALSVDRFLAIYLHLRYQELVTHKRVVATVISIWMFSAIFSLLDNNWIPEKAPIIIFATIGIVCLVTTALINCRIYAAVRRHRNQIQVLQVQHVATNGELVKAARLGKTSVATFYVYLVFLVCNLPITCVNIASIISGPSTNIDTLWVYADTLVFLNSSLNPLIYCWKMRHIRHAVIDILRNVFPGLN